MSRSMANSIKGAEMVIITEVVVTIIIEAEEVHQILDAVEVIISILEVVLVEAEVVILAKKIILIRIIFTIILDREFNVIIMKNWVIDNLK